MTHYSNLTCGKCSGGGQFKTGRTILDEYALLNKTVLGLVKNDPHCVKCGTTFPDGFWREANGYIYRIQSKS
jgi:ribosomal protein S27AE